MNALKLEEEIGIYSDAILIIVESFGSAAELGAFALSGKLRLKLIVLVDKCYEKDESFIATGPLKWIEKDSIYKAPIFEDFNVILDAADKIDSKLRMRGTIEQRNKIYKDALIDEKITGKRLLFYTIELIAILGYSTINHVLYYLENILEIKSKEKVSTIISLAVALGYVNRSVINEGDNGTYFSSNLFKLKGIIRNETYETILREKMIFQAKLFGIDDYNKISKKIEDLNAS